MVTTVGTGCAPLGATLPTLTETNLPIPGSPLGVNVASPSTPSNVGLLVFGFSTTWDPIFNVPLPLSLAHLGFPNCALIPSYEFPIGIMTDANGDASYATQIPALAKWCDREVTFQIFFLDGNSDLLASPGLTQAFGN